ncbi:MAG: helix-turn-helix transcriptional regulator [Bacteroidetes bacterium]|nr:helix-turn-helix transcriptional regulator [Bacteroidota bacterium]
MHIQTIHIKNMCCERCMKVVEDELKKLGLNVSSVELGQASFRQSPKVCLSAIKNMLHKNGFELILSEEEQLVEKIKHCVYDLIHVHQREFERIKYTDYLSEKIKKPYRHLSKIFSEQTKITIERFIILEKIERAKELLEEGEMTFGEIARALGYKSLQHFSAQFKSVTMLTKTQYLHLKRKKRQGIDEI